MRIRRVFVTFAVVFIAAIPAAQASLLTTLFASDNNNAPGGMNFFDLNVLNPDGIKIQQLEVNVIPDNPTPPSIDLDVYVRAGTYSGNESSSAGWTLVSSGSGTASALDTPTTVDLTDFFLGFGLSGIAIQNTNYPAAYTNGTGSNQFYSNADLSLTAGSATNVPFDTAVFSPRVWNGAIEYVVGRELPEPGSLALLGLGLASLATSRRRKQS